MQNNNFIRPVLQNKQTKSNISQSLFFSVIQMHLHLEAHCYYKINIVHGKLNSSCLTILLFVQKQVEQWRKKKYLQ